MRALLIAMAVIAPSAAWSCDTFTSEMFDPGVRTATYTAGKLVIVDHGKTTEYDVVSLGTGIPYRGAMNVADKTKGETVRLLGKSLLVSMEVFEPYCKK